MAAAPDEANPPLLIDPDGVLAAAIRGQRLKFVPRRNAKIIQRAGVVDETKLSQGDRLDIGRQASATPAVPDRSSFAIAETHDHDNP